MQLPLSLIKQFTPINWAITVKIVGFQSTKNFHEIPSNFFIDTAWSTWTPPIVDCSVNLQVVRWFVCPVPIKLGNQPLICTNQIIPFLSRDIPMSIAQFVCELFVRSSPYVQRKVIETRSLFCLALKQRIIFIYL